LAAAAGIAVKQLIKQADRTTQMKKEESFMVDNILAPLLWAITGDKEVQKSVGDLLFLVLVKI